LTRSLFVILIIASALGLYAYAAKKKGDRESAANEHFRKAERWLQALKTAEAKAEFLEAINEYEQIDDYKWAAFTYTELGKMLMVRGESGEGNEGSEKGQGLEFCKKAIDIYKNHKDPDNHDGAAAVLRTIGEIFSARSDTVSELLTDKEKPGRFALAREYFMKAQEEYKAANNLDGQIQMLNKIGGTYLNPSNHEAVGDTGANKDSKKEKSEKSLQAIHYYEEATRLYDLLLKQPAQDDKQIQSTRKELVAQYIHIGKIYRQMNESAKAAESFKQAAEVYQQVNNLKELANTYFEIGSNLDDELADHSAADAEKYYQQALQASRQAGDLKQEGDLLKKIGSSYEDSAFASDGDEEKRLYLKALEHYEQAVRIYNELKDAKAQADTQLIIASVQFELKKFSEALKASEAARDLYKSVDDRKGEAMAYARIADTQVELGQNTEAINAYTTSVSLFSEARDEQTAQQISKRLEKLRKKLGQES
jgi:tetratricopeptide (TPR) repeat protein